MKQTCILVLGMHRSGTSALTGVLEIYGIPAGIDMMEATEDNPKGYFENKNIYNFNKDRLLPALCSEWDDLSLLSDGWENRDILQSLYSEAKKIITEDYKSIPIFSIKDPRISILFPFWEKALIDLDIRIKILIATRSPQEVAESLHKRDGMRFEDGIELWTKHMLSSEVYSRKYPRFIIRYDELLKDPFQILKKLNEDFQLSLPLENNEMMKKLKEFVSPELKRNHHSESSGFSFTDKVYNLFQTGKEFDQTGFDDVEKIFFDRLRHQSTSYTFKYIGNKRSESFEKKIHASSSTAVVIHLYYYDMKDEIYENLTSFDNAIDLFISLPESMEPEKIKTIRKQFPEAHLFITENRGRDILPFLQILQCMELKKYKYICKIHTKKSSHSIDGDLWRELLYYSLLGSKDIIQEHLNMLENSSTGMTTLSSYVLDAKPYMYDNQYSLRNLADCLSIPFNEEFQFAAGTMFWARASIFESIGNINFEELPIFEKECQQIDGTLAHAFERLFGLLCCNVGYQVASIKNQYRDIPTKLIEDMLSAGMAIKYQNTEFQKRNELSMQHISNLGGELEYARGIVVQRDQQLRQKNEETQRQREQMKTQEEQMKTQEEQMKAQEEQMKAQEEQMKAQEEQMLFLKQKYEEKLHEYSARIDHYHQLAESMSIKNRVKKIIPAGVCKKVKTLRPYLTRHNLQKALWYIKRGRFNILLQKVRNKIDSSVSDSRDNLVLVPSDYLKSSLTLPKIRTKKPVDIIIPVYNGYDYLALLFEGILKNTYIDYRLIVIDDASPDERVKVLLKQLMDKHKKTIFLENETNLGFVQSVNKAVKECQNHFVLLNTDTEVPEHWLERLMHPIFNQPMIATTTPFTNAGEIASFPNFLENNTLIENLSVNQINKAFQWINSEKLTLDIPTGVGFCMGVNYDLYTKIGFFDEKNFGKGYGEENDWCRRAAAEGYRNVMTPDLFVYHKHGGSFDSEEKKRLMKTNHSKLLKKHPNYDALVQAFILEDPYKELRYLLRILILANERDTVLVFDHDLGGGANTYSKQCIHTYVKEKKKVLRVAYSFYTQEYRLGFEYEDFNIKMILKKSDELLKLLDRCSFQEIFINELVSYADLGHIQNWIVNYKKRNQCIVTLSLHDYFALCPSFTLLDNNGKFCQLPDIETCQRCLVLNDSEIMMFSDEKNIVKWRQSWRNLLDVTDRVLAFSDSSKKLFLRVYSDFLDDKIVVKPHSVAKIEPIERRKRSSDEKITIGVLGSINEAKGILVLDELVKTIEREHLNIYVRVIGDTNMDIDSKHFYVTGRYDHEKLRETIIDNQIDIFLIPSICPETFSYTTQEIMMTNMPLIVFDLGAPAERVRNYENGAVLEIGNVDSVLDYVRSFFKQGN